MNKYDVIIVGAGGAGLFSAKKLSENGKKVLILDAGMDLENKSCSIETEGKCKYCKPVCSIMGGFGGAQFFEGTKLSIYPAGSGFVDFCGGVDKTKEIYKYIDSVLELHGKSPRQNPKESDVESLRKEFLSQGIIMKYYNAQKVSKPTMNKIAFGLKNELKQLGVDIHLQERVLDIEEIDNFFIIKTDKNEYTCNNVVLAVGRVGSRQLTKLADKCGIKYEDEEHEMEIGVRIEMPYHVFNKVNNVHNDLKLKLKLQDGSELRTFCQDYKGYITKCVYNLDGDKIVSSLDGHIIGTDEESGKLSDVVNLAVHHRFKVDMTLDEIYTTINKRNIKGKPMVQSMKNFMNNTNNINVFSNKLSMPDVIEDNINNYLPEKTLIALKDFIKSIDNVIKGFADECNTVYSPSFEMGWKKFILSEYLETTVNGIYIAGDASGHFRGAMQAMASGVVVANSILRREK